MDSTEDARESLLRAVWSEIRANNEEEVRNVPAAARAIDAGASSEDVATAMRVASYETAFRLLYLVSGEHAPEGQPEASYGWALVPLNLADGTLGNLPTNLLEGVHEDLLAADPTGLEGQDLWE